MRAKSVKQVFEQCGGSNELNGVDEIKAELMRNGPVVSVSFQPSDGYVRSSSSIWGGAGASLFSSFASKRN